MVIDSFPAQIRGNGSLRVYITVKKIINIITKNMKHKLTWLFAMIFLSVSNLLSAQFGDNPVSWNSKVVKADNNIYEIELKGSMGSEWHIYDLGPYKDGPIATTLTISGGDGVKAVGAPYIKTSVHKEFSSSFGMEIGTAGNGVVIAQKVSVSSTNPTSVTVTLEWQTCSGESCMPPADEEITIKLPAAEGVAEPASGNKAENTLTENVKDNTADTSNSLEVADSSATNKNEAVVTENGNDMQASVVTPANEKPLTENGGKSIWAVILEAIAWGFVALLTPCVFPMVPMTVSFFLKNSGGKSKSRGRFMAMFYGFSIIALYTLPIAIIILITYFVGGDAVTADIFNWLATHWIPNILFFLIFMVFAASFFGAFEITMPNWMVNKSDEKSDKGGLIGVFFMALTLVLVSFSCTGPIVSSVLIKSTQGEIWEPIITMFAFSAAFALPFTIFAFAPSLLKDLPKSGGWLNSVKVVLGFIELALGLKFLSVADQVYQWHLLDRETYLALWIVIFSLLGLYLLGKLRFAHDTPTEHLSVKRLFLSIITFAFVVYMIPGMWGAPLKVLSGYLPPIETLDFNLYKGQNQGVSVSSGEQAIAYEIANAKNPAGLKHPDGIHGFYDYTEALEYSKKVGKPLFIDFTGSACVNCREMEARVLSDPRIKQMLNEEYVFLSLYGDVKVDVPESDWVTLPNGKVLKQLGKINTNLVMGKYEVNAMPYYIITDNSGNEIVESRGYDLNVESFIEFLKKGITAYKDAEANN